MKVKVWLDQTSQPLCFENAETYTKGKLFCVYVREQNKVTKFPIKHIFRVEEEYQIPTENIE